MLQPLLLVREVVKILDTTKYNLIKLSDSGELPRYKIGKSVRYKIDDVKEYIKQQNK